MPHWYKVSPGRYKHPACEAYVKFDLETSLWTLQHKDDPNDGSLFYLKVKALQAFTEKQEPNNGVTIGSID